MATASGWFPDYVAEWYDAFELEYDEPRIQRVWRTRPSEVGTWTSDLLRDPHASAWTLNDRLASLTGDELSEQRYFALLAASDAFVRAGIFPVHSFGSEGWEDLRTHWRATGSLLKDATGLMLPKRDRPYRWLPNRSEREHGPNTYFSGFTRVHPAGLRLFSEVKVRVMVDLDGRADRLRKQLVVAVAPLIETLDELVFERIEKPGARRAYRVRPAPLDWPKRATALINGAAKAGADILIFPELCFSPDTQKALAEEIRAAAAQFGGPLLVVAGSAHTPSATHPTEFHNCCLVYDATGAEILRHNKLHAYAMSPGEQDRYGLAAVLDGRDRQEDIVVVPKRLEVLETPLGRIAVLICEDLSVPKMFLPLAKELELDWFFVPVMDGAQNEHRWTATRAKQYADGGTAVVVVTCAALIASHRKFDKDNNKPDPGDKIGLVVHPKNSHKVDVLSHAPMSITMHIIP